MKLKREVKIGAYIVATLFIMYWVFNFLKGQDIFNKSVTYYARYESVEGLVPTAQVYIKGLKVGIIEKIEYEQKEKLFLVRLRVEAGYIIPENSIAKIFNADLMGNKAVSIVLGSSPKQLAPGSIMASDISTDLMTEIMPLKGKLDSLLIKTNETFAAINNILTEEKQNEIKSIITNLATSTSNLAALTNTLNEEKTHLSNTMKNAETFTASLAQNTGNITAMLENLKAVSDTLHNTEIGALIAKVNNLLSAANSLDGTVGQLLHNDELYKNLSSTLHDLDLLLQDLKANPKKYVKLSLF